MAEAQFKIREKSTGNEITCNWQNAFELVNHGFWEWASGNPQKEFKRAQREAKGQNPDPQGFEHLNDVDDSDDSDDDDYTPPPAPPAPAPTIQQVAQTPVITEDGDGLEDLSREELFALYAKETNGKKIDKRTGTKRLIEEIREERESAE